MSILPIVHSRKRGKADSEIFLGASYDLYVCRKKRSETAQLQRIDFRALLQLDLKPNSDESGYYPFRIGYSFTIAASKVISRTKKVDIHAIESSLRPACFLLLSFQSPDFLLPWLQSYDTPVDQSLLRVLNQSSLVFKVLLFDLHTAEDDNTSVSLQQKSKVNFYNYSFY